MYDAEAVMFSEEGFPCSPLYYYTNSYCLSQEGIQNVAMSSLGFFIFTEATQG
jgi:hypothetical protein